MDRHSTYSYINNLDNKSGKQSVMPRQETKDEEEKKIQNEHPLFEASTVILAQYLQVGMAIRQRLIWVASPQANAIVHGKARTTCLLNS